MPPAHVAHVVADQVPHPSVALLARSQVHLFTQRMLGRYRPKSKPGKDGSH